MIKKLFGLIKQAPRTLIIDTPIYLLSTTSSTIGFGWKYFIQEPFQLALTYLILKPAIYLYKKIRNEDTINKLTAEKQALTAENEALTAESKNLKSENKALTEENNALTAENQALTAENKTPKMVERSNTLFFQSPLKISGGIYSYGLTSPKGTPPHNNGNINTPKDSSLVEKLEQQIIAKDKKITALEEELGVLKGNQQWLTGNNTAIQQQITALEEEGVLQENQQWLDDDKIDDYGDWYINRLGPNN